MVEDVGLLGRGLVAFVTVPTLVKAQRKGRQGGDQRGWSRRKFLEGTVGPPLGFQVDSAQVFFPLPLAAPTD